MELNYTGNEIDNCIRRNSAQSAYNWNLKQAEKYLKSVVKSGDDAIIAYAKLCLEKVKRGEY